jgi:hypothetical protein
MIELNMDKVTQNNGSAWCGLYVMVFQIVLGSIMYFLYSQYKSCDFCHMGGVALLGMGTLGIVLGVPVGLVIHFFFGFRRTIQIDFKRQCIGIETHKLIKGAKWAYQSASEIRSISLNTSDGKITLEFNNREFCDIRSETIKFTSLSNPKRAYAFANALGFHHSIKEYYNSGGGGG